MHIQIENIYIHYILPIYMVIYAFIPLYACIFAYIGVFWACIWVYPASLLPQLGELPITPRELRKTTKCKHNIGPTL